MRDMTFRERDFLIGELDKNDPEHKAKVEALEKECEEWHDENDVIEIGEDGTWYFFEKGAEEPYGINLPV